MIIDLTKLNNGIEEEVIINQSFEVPEEELAKSDILQLKDAKVSGTITKSDIDYNLNLEISGLMVLKCAITLEPVDYPFNITVNGGLEEIIQEIAGNVKKSENCIDIFPIIWENILVEVPMKVVSEKAQNFKVEGVGWKLVTEDNVKKEINPELEKLKKLL